MLKVGAQGKEQRLGSWWPGELDAEGKTGGLVPGGGHGEYGSTGLRERNDVTKKTPAVDCRVAVAKGRDAVSRDRQQRIDPSIDHLGEQVVDEGLAALLGFEVAPGWDAPTVVDSLADLGRVLRRGPVSSVHG